MGERESGREGEWERVGVEWERERVREREREGERKSGREGGRRENIHLFSDVMSTDVGSHGLRHIYVRRKLSQLDTTHWSSKPFASTFEDTP